MVVTCYPPRDIPVAVAVINLYHSASILRERYRYVTSTRKRYSKRAEIIAFAVEPVHPRGDVLLSAVEWLEENERQLNQHLGPVAVRHRLGHKIHT